MNLRQFKRELPQHYNNFLHPTSFSQESYGFSKKLSLPVGATTKYIGHLLNYAISLMESDEAHLHIGVYKGLSLAYALAGNEEKIHYVNDDFSHEVGLREEFESWAKKAQVFSHIHFHEGDCFAYLQADPPMIQHKIAVYFYDADHSYQGQLRALEYVEPYLADQAIIVIDDTNREEPRNANRAWLNQNPHVHLLFDLPTPQNCHPTWWNGIQVLGYELAR